MQLSFLGLLAVVGGSWLFGVFCAIHFADRFKAWGEAKKLAAIEKIKRI